jgi:hypothetical protein
LGLIYLLMKAIVGAFENYVIFFRSSMFEKYTFSWNKKKVFKYLLFSKSLRFV